MRVLVVGARGIPNVEGGAEKNAEMIFPLMVDRGAEVDLLCLNGTSSGDEFRGVKLRRAPSLKLLGTDKLAAYVFAPFYALKRRPQVVHFQGLGSAIFLLLYRMAGVRTVVRYGSADYLVGKWGWIGRAGFLWAEWQLRFAHRVVAVTPALADRLRDRGIVDNVVVIPNAVDEAVPPRDTANLDRFELHGKRFALAVGRVTAQKNFPLLIDAFHKAKAQGARLDKLVIVGGLDEEAYVETLHSHLSEDVILTGRLPRNSFLDLFASCAVFVNSSIHEGHSNAIMEAISYQRPLIVSDIPENLDLPLSDDHYFRSGDVESLTQKLCEFDVSPEHFATERDRFLDWNQVAAQTFALYQERAA